MHRNHFHRPEFADTVTALSPQHPLARMLDPIEQLIRAERQDWALLRLVLCVATATMLLALASSMV